MPLYRHPSDGSTPTRFYLYPGKHAAGDLEGQQLPPLEEAGLVHAQIDTGTHEAPTGLLHTSLGDGMYWILEYLSDMVPALFDCDEGAALTKKGAALHRLLKEAQCQVQSRRGHGKMIPLRQLGTIACVAQRVADSAGFSMNAAAAAALPIAYQSVRSIAKGEDDPIEHLAPVYYDWQCHRAAGEDVKHQTLVAARQYHESRAAGGHDTIKECFTVSATAEGPGKTDLTPYAATYRRLMWDCAVALAAVHPNESVVLTCKGKHFSCDNAAILRIRLAGDIQLTCLVDGPEAVVYRGLQSDTTKHQDVVPLLRHMQAAVIEGPKLQSARGCLEEAARVLRAKGHKASVCVNSPGCPPILCLQKDGGPELAVLKGQPWGRCSVHEIYPAKDTAEMPLGYEPTGCKEILFTQDYGEHLAWHAMGLYAEHMKLLEEKAEEAKENAATDDA